MNTIMHERIASAALAFLRRSGVAFPEQEEQFLIRAANYPDIFWGQTADMREKDADDPDWRRYILIPMPDGSLGNCHCAFSSLRMREMEPLFRYWLKSAAAALAGNDFHVLAGFTGCLSHVVADTFQAVHLLDERQFSDMFPQIKTCYITHRVVEAVSAPVRDEGYTPSVLAASLEELVWRAVEDSEISRRRECAEIPVMLNAIENHDDAAAQASAGRAALHAAHMTADLFLSVYALAGKAGSAGAAPLFCDLRTFSPVEQFCDPYFNYRIIIDRIPGKDPYSPLPLDAGAGAAPGIAMLPNLVPFFRGTREAFAEYSIPSGIFRRFEASVGLVRGAENATSVIFEVLADDRSIYQSAPVGPDSAPVRIAVELGNASRLRLRVYDAREDAYMTRFVYPAWLNPRLVR